jgi:hypothetical protein
LLSGFFGLGAQASCLLLATKMASGVPMRCLLPVPKKTK